MADAIVNTAMKSQTALPPLVGDKKIVASIEARMTSKRLPGKVLKEFCDGKPMLQVLIERLRASRYLADIVVATTNNTTDDPIVRLCEGMGVSYFRGSEEDVLGRVIGAVASVAGDIIVEVTGDCPVLDPVVVDYVIESYLSNYPKFDYVCNTGLGDLEQHAIPLGMDVQVFTYQDLARIGSLSTDPDDREHVSLYFYRDGGCNHYSLLNVPIPERWRRGYPVRLTVDTAEDYLVVQKIYESLHASNVFTLEEILNFCDTHPEIVAMNANVKQNRPAGFK